MKFGNPRQGLAGGHKQNAQEEGKGKTESVSQGEPASRGDKRIRPSRAGGKKALKKGFRADQTQGGER